MYQDTNHVPVPATLLQEAQRWAPVVGFDFAVYEKEWMEINDYYLGSRESAFLDWLGLHLFLQAEEGRPSPLPPDHWPAELWDFYRRLEARNVMVIQRMDGGPTYHGKAEHTGDDPHRPPA